MTQGRGVVIFLQVYSSGYMMVGKLKYRGESFNVDSKSNYGLGTSGSFSSVSKFYYTCANEFAHVLIQFILE